MTVTKEYLSTLSESELFSLREAVRIALESKRKSNRHNELMEARKHPDKHICFDSSK